MDTSLHFVIDQLQIKMKYVSIGHAWDFHKNIQNRHFGPNIRKHPRPCVLTLYKPTKGNFEYRTKKTNESATYAVDVNFNGSIFVRTKRGAKKNTIVMKTIMNHIMSM